jgi:hypothetical protein
MASFGPRRSATARPLRGALAAIRRVGYGRASDMLAGEWSQRSGFSSAPGPPPELLTLTITLVAALSASVTGSRVRESSSSPTVPSARQPTRLI